MSIKMIYNTTTFIKERIPVSSGKVQQCKLQSLLQQLNISWDREDLRRGIPCLKSLLHIHLNRQSGVYRKGQSLGESQEKTEKRREWRINTEPSKVRRWDEINKGKWACCDED